MRKILYLWKKEASRLNSVLMSVPRSSVHEAKSKGLKKVERMKKTWKAFIKDGKSDNHASGENEAIFWLQPRESRPLYFTDGIFGSWEI